MRTETTVTEVYTFSELSDEAKERARDWYRSADDFSFHAECVIEDAKAIGALMGITIDKVYYSGFSSQGDGACFEGAYSYKTCALKAIKEYAPKDETLHKIAKRLQDIQKSAFYSLHAKVKHSGHYYHAYCTNIEVYHNDDQYRVVPQEDDLKTALRDFMQWIYSQLEKEYWYQNSDEVTDQNIIANEYEFTKDGKIF